MGRITVAGIRGSTHAERSLVGLRGVAGLMIVGVNVGSIDKALDDLSRRSIQRSWDRRRFRFGPHATNAGNAASTGVNSAPRRLWA